MARMFKKNAFPSSNLSELNEHEPDGLRVTVRTITGDVVQSLVMASTTTVLQLKSQIAEALEVAPVQVKLLEGLAVLCGNVRLCDISAPNNEINLQAVSVVLQFNELPNLDVLQYDYLFRLLIIGDTCVGKSCLLQRMVDDTYTNSCCTTIGTDFKIRTIQLDESFVKLQIWDTPGAGRFRKTTSSSYRGAHGFIVVYDVTDRESFNDIRNWLDDIEQCCNIGCNNLLILGNKCDDDRRRSVSFTEGKVFASSVGAQFLEVSAKTSYNVECALHTIAMDVKERGMQSPESQPPSPVKRITRSANLQPDIRQITVLRLAVFPPMLVVLILAMFVSWPASRSDRHTLHLGAIHDLALDHAIRSGDSVQWLLV